MTQTTRVLRQSFISGLVAVLMLSGVLVSEQAPVVNAQSASDLTVTVFAPAYVTAGSNITYELTVRNKGNATVSNIAIQDTVPANATYVSGGTLIGNVVEFTIASLAAGASQQLTFTVNVPGGVAVGTAIENKDIGVFVGADGFDATGVVTTVEAPGTVVAVYKNASGTAFDPALHSYSFPNYGNEAPRNSSDDLGADDLFRLFGASACQSGTTEADCVLSGPAKKWAESQIAGANGGHCEGMAVTSIRLFDELDFKGLSTPADYQSGASTAADLNFPLAELENHIMYYFVPQEFNEVMGATIRKSPNELVDILKTGFNANPSVGYTVGIYVVPGFKKGHAITAYGVEEVSSTGEVRILVYDNNFPRQRQYITVNPTANTWRYATASTPGQPVEIYEGTATSNNLEITPISAREQTAGQVFSCPFCNQTVTVARVQAAAVDQVAGTIRFEYADEGAFLVVNDEDQATGFDFNTETFVDEIPDAVVTFFKGGLDKEIPPTIDVPYVEADDAVYSVFISGKTINSQTDGSLTMTGAGYAMGLDFIQLNPDELLELAISPDGDFIGFNASQTVDAPALFISYDPVSDEDPSVIFEVDGVILDAGEQVSLELDPDLERVFFDDTGGLGQQFDVTMELIWPDGDVEVFTQEIDVPAGSTSAFIDFGAWDGLLDPPIYIDDVLQNPNVNHRLKLESSNATYDPAPQPNAPAGVYRVEATFTNVTEVSLEELYFTVADLGAGNVVLNADGGPGGVGAVVSVPGTLLGSDELLDVNESFTFVFDIGVASVQDFEFSVDANGIPFDWNPTDPPPSGDANNASFDFALDFDDLPVCSNATPSQTVLWPPNHQFVDITIQGVTEKDGDTVSSIVTSIFQDEPVGAAGSGNTQPDGQGVGSSTAEVRAERAGKGNGRVYHIGFRAENDFSFCTGEVLVSVPKSKKKSAVDDGSLYDSTSMGGTPRVGVEAFSTTDNVQRNSIFLPLVTK